MKVPVTDYYISKKSKLLKSFDRSANLVRSTVVSTYGESFTDTVIRDARREYEKLIPLLPPVDGAPTLRSFLIIAAQELAVFRAMTNHGKTAGEAWEICHMALRLRLRKNPKSARWIARQLLFSTLMRRLARKRGAKSQQRPIGQFVWNYVEGNGETCDFGVDYTGCGIHKFMCEQGAAEFAPYACMSDISLSDSLGWGLTRTKTLAEGSDRCNFRFRKGGETKISSSIAEVQATIEKIREQEASQVA